MRERFQTPFPILFAQYHLLGSTRRFVSIAAAYTGLLVLGIMVYRRTQPRVDWSVVASYVMYVLPVIQSGILVLGSLGAMHKALMRDHQSAMIESHRLTPMSNVAIAMGYLLGPTLQVNMLFCINLVIGSLLFLVAGQPLWQWVCGNLILLSGVLTMWSMMVFLGVGMRKPTSSVGIFVAVGMFFNLFVMLLPGAGLMLGLHAVLCGVLLTYGASAITGLGVFLFVPPAVSLMLTAFWLLAAASRYRRPDLPALNAARGIVLLLLWLVMTGVGMVVYQTALENGVRLPDAKGYYQWPAGLISSLLVGLVPLAGAVYCRQKILEGASPRGWTDRVPDGLVAAVVPLLMCAVLAVIGFHVWGGLDGPLPPPDSDRASRAWGTASRTELIRLWGTTAAASVLFTVTLLGLLRGAAAVRGLRVVVIVLAILGLAGPPLIDGILTALQHDYGYTPAPSWVFGCSPAGTMIAAWMLMNTPLLPGLGVQAAVAVTALAAAHLLRRRREELRAGSPVVPAA